MVWVVQVEFDAGSRNQQPMSAVRKFGATLEQLLLDRGLHQARWKEAFMQPAGYLAD